MVMTGEANVHVSLMGEVQIIFDFGCPHHHPGAWYSPTYGVPALPK